MDGIEYALLELMDDRGMSQSELARRSNVAVSNINRYLKGGDMAASKAVRIADALGVSVDELLGLEDSPSDELELLGYYRSASVRGKANILEYAEDAARRHPKNTDDSASAKAV